jgi:hypothetical protein
MQQADYGQMLCRLKERSHPDQVNVADKDEVDQGKHPDHDKRNDNIKLYHSIFPFTSSMRVLM